MKTISELKMERERKISDLSTACGLFWAFSDKQFEENKTPLQPGEKYVRIPGGGFMPKGKVEEFLSGLEAASQWYKDQIKEHGLRKANISYELNNHEAHYTGSIESTLEALGEGYTEDEVWAVYRLGEGEEQVGDVYELETH